jgi:hypothetical protein
VWSPFSSRRIVIEFHEQHQSGPAQTSINYTLEFDEVFCASRCFGELDHVRLPDPFF